MAAAAAPVSHRLVVVSAAAGSRREAASSPTRVRSPRPARLPPSVPPVPVNGLRKGSVSPWSHPIVCLPWPCPVGRINFWGAAGSEHTHRPIDRSKGPSLSTRRILGPQMISREGRGKPSLRGPTRIRAARTTRARPKIGGGSMYPIARRNDWGRRGQPRSPHDEGVQAGPPVFRLRRERWRTPAGLGVSLRNNSWATWGRRHTGSRSSFIGWKSIEGGRTDDAACSNTHTARRRAQCVGCGVFRRKWPATPHNSITGLLECASTFFFRRVESSQ